MIDYIKADPKPPPAWVWIVTIADRPPMVFAALVQAMTYIEIQLRGAIGGRQILVGMYKTQVAA